MNLSKPDRIGASGRKSSALRPVVERMDDRVMLDAGLSAGVWTVSVAAGRMRGPAVNTIVIGRDSARPEILNATINGKLAGSVNDADVQLIRVVGGRGRDTIRFDETVGAIALPTVLEGKGGDDLILGSSGPDRILGGAGRDRLFGWVGDDVLLGGSGADMLDGGDGVDRLEGGSGRNVMAPGGGQDSVKGVAVSKAADRTVRDQRSHHADPGPYVAPHPLPPTGSLRAFGSGEELLRFLIDAASRGFRTPGSGGVGVFLPQADSAALATGAAPSTAPAPAPTAANPASFSNTNVQLAGVDEADIVKTDGQFLYILSRQQLLIVSARPADQAAVVSRTDLGGYPSGEYLDGDRLTVVSTVYDEPAAGGSAGAAAVPTLAIYRPLNSRVRVTQFDVSDRTTPRILQQTDLDGNIIDSRSADGKVYVAVQSDTASRVQPLLLPADAANESADAFRARLEAADLATLAPEFVTRAGGPSGPVVRSGLLTDPRKIFRPETDQDVNLLSLVVFDAGAGFTGPVDSAGAFGSYATTLYATKDSAYLLTPRYASDGGSSTSIVKFRLAGGVTAEAAGQVPGTLLNQFSVDEFGGFLRIATTTSRPGPNLRAVTANNVYVLEQADSALNIVGRLENLAPNEQIFSARFDGERGYLVTFRQVDPLFTLDLSDPRNPKIAGELKVPGFSRYLQPIAPGLVLGVGRDADPVTGRTQGFQVSLFDVSDPAAPQRIAQTLITPPGAGWTFSDAEYDHHAISYFPDQKILTLPVSGYDNTAAGSGPFGVGSFRSSLYVFHVDAESGFRLIGKIDQDSAVLRSVRIEDDLYSLAERSLKVNRLDDSLAELRAVTLQTDTGPSGGPIFAQASPGVAI